MMSKCKHITPETVAHNTASALLNKFISNSDNINFSSLDDTDVRTMANEAALIYAVAYDEAYAKISHLNDDLINNPE